MKNFSISIPFVLSFTAPSLLFSCASTLIVITDRLVYYATFELLIFSLMGLLTLLLTIKSALKRQQTAREMRQLTVTAGVQSSLNSSRLVSLLCSSLIDRLIESTVQYRLRRVPYTVYHIKSILPLWTVQQSTNWNWMRLTVERYGILVVRVHIPEAYSTGAHKA